MPERTFHELAHEFRRLSDFLHVGGSPDTARQWLVDLAVAVVPGCDWASIAVHPPVSTPHTVAASHDIARAADALQHETGDGPIFRAIGGDELAASADLPAETQWARFSSAVSDRTPVRGAMSFHLTDLPNPTALSLYTGTPGAFGEETVTTGALFAVHAASLMAHAHSAHQAATLGEALSASRQIGAAIGILMAAHKITEDEAFAVLKAGSNRLNRKLRDIAQHVTDTGQLPEGNGTTSAR